MYYVVISHSKYNIIFTGIQLLLLKKQLTKNICKECREKVSVSLVSQDSQDATPTRLSSNWDF